METVCLPSQGSRVPPGTRCYVTGICALLWLDRLCYNQLQKYLRHCTVFWLKWPVHDLVLVIPPPPLIKVASNTRPCTKLGGTTLNGMEEGGQYYISQTCGWQRFEARKVVFSSECLKIFAAGCNIVSGIICHYEHNFDVFSEKSTATIICTFG